MKSSVVTAFEHDVLPVIDGSEGSLRPHEVQKLLKLNSERPGFCSAGLGTVRLSRYAGLVNLGGRMLEVLPKVGEAPGADESRGTFLRLLRLGHGASVFSTGKAGHNLQRGSLLAVFVSYFLTEVGLVTRAGLLRRYRSHEDELPVVRGRLDIRRQASVFGMRPDLLACSYDELAVDNPWNQVLKAALMAVRPWIDGVEDGRRWLELVSAFGEVSLRRDATVMLSGLVPDRQVRHYSAALEWATLILRLLSPNVRAGQTYAPELLFDMNMLFERAVTTAMRRRAGGGMRVTDQERGRHLAVVGIHEPRQVFQLRPDLVVRSGDSVLAVGDTKWKRPEVARNGWLLPAESDVYQMHAYAAAYECSDFCLIYPYHPELADAVPVSFRLPSINGRQPWLRVALVDVARDGLPVQAGSEGGWFS